MTQSAAQGFQFVIDVPTAESMQYLGKTVASLFKSGDVVLLSGPLGAGKTTFAQGIGEGLHLHDAIVSPTFTIARELDGRFMDGSPVRLIHVDAYRIGGVEHAPGSDVATALLDELESLGLDEELENPSEGSVVLMEWGEHMAGILSSERLEVRIDRSSLKSQKIDELTERGVRRVIFNPVGESWRSRRKNLEFFANITTLMREKSEFMPCLGLENGETE